MDTQHKRAPDAGSRPRGGVPVGKAAKAVGAEIDLRPAAERAACAYYETRKSKAGISQPPPQKAYRNDRRWCDFLRIASLCDSEGWDPADYVVRGIEGLGQNAVFMVPSDLLVDGVKASYRRRAAEAGTLDVPTAPDEDLEFADETLKSMCGNDRESRERALMSPFTQFPSWYRALRGSAGVLEAWAPAAASDLRSSKALREWFSARFPKVLDRIYEASKEDSNGR